MKELITLRKFSCILAVLVLYVSIAPAQSATIAVTTTTDERSDPGPGTGCSLREAIQSVNNAVNYGGCSNTGAAYGTSDTINIPSGTYAIAIATTNEDLNVNGDYDINASVAIVGAGAVATIIDGGAIDRVFHIIGAITASFSGVTIQNGKETVGGGGGGIYNSGGTLTVTNSAISNNQSLYYNGGGISSSGTSTITNSTISNNTGRPGGGGIFSSGITTVTNSTISGNLAMFGGGIYSTNTSTVTNSTISSNSASNGGGIYNTGGGTVTFTNTIVNQSLASGGGCVGTLTSGGHNLDLFNTCRFTGTGDLINTNPQLSALASNGGPTQTHALLEGSPAIDAGPATCAAAPVNGLDQRGTARPKGSACDIGAYEAAAINGVCGVANGVTVSSIPAYYLCNIGSPSAVAGSGPWTWSCYGIYGGVNASCSAPVVMLNQTISFSAAPSVIAGGTGTVSATATSGLAVSFSSTPLSVCTVSSTGIVTGVSAGTCYVAANQAGNASYHAASQVVQSITIAAASPPTCTLTASSPSITAGGISLLTASCTPAATSYAWSANTGFGSTATSGTVSPMLTTTYTVTGSNTLGAGNTATATVTVIAVAPNAPTLTSATPGNASNTLNFTAPTSTGGAAITNYTATCTASGQPTRSATGSSSPIIVSRLAFGVAYSCTVTATNSAGTSIASNALSVTPTDIASATTVLEMPWFTKVPGYISRFVLLNTGSSAASYNITVLTENGNAVALNASFASGSIAAGSQLVINVDDLVTGFSVGQRAIAIITSSAPVGTLSGIYNLVQPTTGAISNVSLIRGQDFAGTSSVLLGPWFTTSSGYSSAFILSNTGNTDATATVSFLSPTGTTVTPLLSALTLPAQGQLIVDTSTLATLTGGPDAAVVFNLNAPEGRIKGTYKIVNTAYGTASSTELINPQSTSGSTTRLVAPWFSTAAGYSSDFILTNRGGSAAAYIVTVQAETGNTPTTGTLTGSIPANGQVILSASSLVSSFSGATRASAIFDVTGSPSVIDGAYQIISTTTGAISTTILARADTTGSTTTTLKLPWFSGATGYVSRFVLVNRNAAAAPFTIQILPESGNVATQILTSGTIPANGQLVLPVANVISGFSGSTRAAAVFTVSAPAAYIDGIYNIVNPTSGTISNTMMTK